MDLFACRMTCNSVDDILKCFDRLEKNGNLTLPVKNHIHILKVELRFMRIIMRWTMTWGRTCIYGHFFADIETGVRHAKKKLLQPSTEADATFLNEILSSLLENIRVQKDATKKFCLYNFRNHLNSSMSYADHVVIDLVELLDPLLENLKYYVGCTDVDLVVLLKDQMKVLMEKLRFLRQFLKFIEKKQEMFKADEDWRKTWEMTRIQVLTENAALLSYLCWLEDMHAGIHLRSMFGDLLLKIKHIEPEIRMIYVNILKVSKKGTLLIDLGSLVALDSLLENIEELQNLDAASLVPIEDDEIETLHQELIYLKDFLLHPPPKQYIQPEKFDYLLLQVEATAVEVGSFIHSFCHSQRKHDIAGEMLPLYHLRTNIILMKAEIKEIYLKVPKPSPSEFPRTQNLGFIDFFLQNLDDLLNYGAVSIATVENNLKTVRSELAILRNLLDDLLNLLKGSEELEDIVQHVANVAYEAECVIDFITLNDGGFWYYMLWLVDVIEKIKLLKTEITSTHDKKMQDIRYHTIEKASCLESSEDNTQVDEEVVGFEDQGKQMIEKDSYLESSQDNTLIDEEVVGFNDQAEKIIDLLQRGSQQLGIVSIIGMPGLGKTTLAKKVYNDPSIKFHFHVRMWCRVSQVSERKRLLLDILHNNIGPTDRISEMTDIDLAAVLCKKLRGMKFLVVMDDVWSLEVWKDLKSSFPDDRNGSRILFTSRINDVALPANSNNTPHYLRLFTEEESWELLQKKVFPQKSCPPKLSIVGKQIAANCKGLPLSVVVVAGILRKMETEDQWKQIAESLGQHCVGEQRECMNVLEMSYKHLPDHLKPCFLYFGVLLEDKEIAVRKLIWLWIAEGFVQKTEATILEAVGEGYLLDLIGRSLVMVAKNDCIGGVKSCHIHDLLHEFCLAKAKQENFSLLLHSNEKHYTSSQALEHHRVCIYWSAEDFIWWRPSNPLIRSILFFATAQQRYLEFSYPSDLSFLCYSSKLLRVLDVESIILDYTFPPAIELLVHLRYLAIQGRMVSVPSSIVNLRKLETFLVRGVDGGVELPDTLWEMASLRHLCILYSADFKIPDGENDDSFQLDHLETLTSPCFWFGDDTAEMILRKLQSLRKLKCSFLQSRDLSRRSNQFPVLEFPSKLESLNMSLEQFYDSKVLYSPELNFPLNLKKLTLSNFRLPWSEISKIGKLPNLEALKLLSRAFEGPIWDVENGQFVNLKFLKLDTLNLAQWNASCDHFPSLQRLVLRNCTKLLEIPSSLGDICTLVMIEVYWCCRSAINSAKKIHEEQQDMGNDALKVLINPLDWDPVDISPPNGHSSSPITCCPM